MHILDLFTSTTHTLDQVKINVWSTSSGINFKKHGWKLQRTLQIWFSQHVPSKLGQCIMYVGEGQDKRPFLGLEAQKWGRPSMQVEAPLPYGWNQFWTRSSPLYITSLVSLFRQLFSLFPEWNRQPSAGSNFCAFVSFTCNVNRHWDDVNQQWGKLVTLWNGPWWIPIGVT
jgi:hypothetical protein